MTPKTKADSKSAEAKLFWNGRSQAVRLPKKFRFVGDRVRVRRVGTGVLLEPVSKRRKEALEDVFAHMDSMGADPLFPEGRKGADLVAAMQASPFKEIGLEPERPRMPVREVRL
ncbi:MAG: AbrB/MazE/SpoVT family DNA-binding domain-containing protein [Terracidiphilus sp.]|jgi:antitoxin VapB